MQDFETDSYWAIMSGKAIAGEMAGTELKEMPVSEKVQWQEWVKNYPNTVVLSVDGREDAPNVYRDYYSSKRGFRNTTAKDDRLNTKTPILAFQKDGKSYAIAHENVEGGKAVTLEGGIHLFFYRPKGASPFASTVVYQATQRGFTEDDGTWHHKASGCTFDPESQSFQGTDACPERLAGLDTFWYTWSLSNPDTELLK